VAARRKTLSLIPLALCAAVSGCGRSSVAPGPTPDAGTAHCPWRFEQVDVKLNTNVISFVGDSLDLVVDGRGEAHNAYSFDNNTAVRYATTACR